MPAVPAVGPAAVRSLCEFKELRDFQRHWAAVKMNSAHVFPLIKPKSLMTPHHSNTTNSMTMIGKA